MAVFAAPRNRGGPTCFRGLDRCPCVGISGSSPEVGPRTAFELPEVLDFHNPLAALAHELQTAVQVQNLYTIPAAFEDTAQKVVIVSQASARCP